MAQGQNMTSGNAISMTGNIPETESLPTADETGFVDPTHEDVDDDFMRTARAIWSN